MESEQGATINPQINYLRDYKLEEGELDNLKIEYNSAEDKESFELALLNRIWNTKQTELSNYTITVGQDTYTVKYRYGVNKDNVVGNSSKIFGITHAQRIVDNKPEVYKAYFFVYAYSELNGKGILRIHEIIKTSNYYIYYYEGSSESSYSPGTWYGLYHVNIRNEVPNNFRTYMPLLGFKAETDSTGSVTRHLFHLPVKSFCFQGRHENIVDLGENYEGKFEILNPSIKVGN